jgi:hypothetical protein
MVQTGSHVAGSNWSGHPPQSLSCSSTFCKGGVTAMKHEPYATPSLVSASS